MKIIATFSSEGYTSVWRENASGRVFGTGDLDIDADGANGQHGARPAYMVGDKGTEFLANGGMKMLNGKVRGASSWFRDIVILDDAGNPREFPGGVIASKTAYRYKGKHLDDPEAYVDSETIPYIVVQKDIIARTRGAVLGCRARATNSVTGEVVDCITADAGPRKKIGEGSIALARLLGLNASPRSGGTTKPIITYELWPGEHGKLDTLLLPLLTSKGAFILPPC